MTRDIEKQPYTLDEARVAAFFCDRGVGGGDDPIGAMLAGYVYLVEQRNALALQVSILTNERDEARTRAAV